jgi:hypothetical protein
MNAAANTYSITSSGPGKKGTARISIPSAPAVSTLIPISNFVVQGQLGDDVVQAPAHLTFPSSPLSGLPDARKTSDP